MGDQQDRLPVGVEVDRSSRALRAAARVERAGRLVGQQQRPAGSSAPGRSPPAAARRRRAAPGRHRGRVGDPQRGRAARGARSRRAARQRRRAAPAAATLSSDGQVVEQVEELEDHADVRGGSVRASAASLSRSTRLAADGDLAVGRPVQPGDEVEQRRLAAAGWTHDRDASTGRDLEIDRGDGGPVGAVVALGHPLAAGSVSHARPPALRRRRFERTCREGRGRRVGRRRPRGRNRVIPPADRRSGSSLRRMVASSARRRPPREETHYSPAMAVRTTWRLLALDVVPVVALADLAVIVNDGERGRSPFPTLLLVVLPPLVRRSMPLVVLLVVSDGDTLTAAASPSPVVQILSVALASADAGFGPRSDDRRADAQRRHRRRGRVLPRGRPARARRRRVSSRSSCRS